LWAGVLAFGAVALTLFDVRVVAWCFGLGLLVALFVSAIPRLREVRRGQ
jgi:UDP-GlcNAc:undecaprenyl-phosphate GlcNAc-1-phosphate transferase